jgi:hypothetical protein
LQALELALMTQLYARLDRVHDRFRRRLKLGLAVRWGLRGAGLGLAGALAVSLAGLLAQGLVPEAYFRLLVLGLGLGAALAGALALAWPQSRLDTAIELDGRLGLQERLATAVELRRRGWATTGAIGRLQLEDTLRLCVAKESGAALPVPVVRRDVVIAALLLLSSLLPLLLGRSAFEAARRQQAVDRAVQAEAARIEALQLQIAETEGLSPEQREALGRPLQTLEQQLSEARSPEAALAALSEGERDLRELARPKSLALADTLRATGERLRQSTDRELAALGQQLAQGDFQAAAETLRQMDLRPSTAAQAEAQARQLDAAAEMAQAATPELAQALRETASSLRNSDSTGARQSLAGAAQAMDDVGQEVLQAEMAAAAAESLSQAEGRTRQLAQEMAESAGQARRSQGDSQGPMGGAQSEGAGASQGQSGSNASPGQNEGGGAGRGESAAGQVQGSSGSGQISQGNAPGDGGIRSYQPLQPSARLGGEGGTNLALAGSGEAGDLVLRNLGLAPGAEADAQVPYTEVFGLYEAAARTAIDNLRPPPFLEALVRQYFSSLSP